MKQLLAVVLMAGSIIQAQTPAPDLRGIYIYTNDVSQITNGTANALKSSFTIVGVDGVALVIGWNAVEPSMGQFDWTLLDQWIAQISALGKKIDLVIPAGSSIPPWVFQQPPLGAGAVQLTFTVSPHAGETGVCDMVQLAPPWDAAYLAQFDAMLAALSAHLKGAGTYDAITLLRLTGINRTTEELRLPAETAASTGLACVSNSITTWQQAGYRPSLLLQGWNAVLGSFTNSFPDKSFSVSIIPNDAFPGIAEDGSAITGHIGDEDEPLINAAAQQFGNRLVVQFDFLMPGVQTSTVVTNAAQNLGTQSAWQTNEYLGNQGAGCSEPITTTIPCTASTYLTLLETGIYPLGRSSTLRSQYIEVFHANATAFPADIEQAHLELTCDYTLSLGGQSFSAAGGTGTITITTAPGCPWTAGTPPAGMVFTSASSGTGNGVITFQLAPNTGGDGANSVAIAGQSFTVEQEAASIPSLSFIGSMPHLAAEGGWSTTLTFVNKGATSAIARTSLFAPDGTPLSLPVALPQQATITGPLLGSTLDQSIAPNASLVMQAAGPADVQFLEGSAQLASNGSVDGFEIFHYDPTAQEAIVPMETRNASSYLLAFDNTNGVVTGVALENVASAAANIPMIIRDETGAVLLSTTVNLNGSGHTSFLLANLYPSTVNKRGTVEFDTPAGGRISMLGLRATPQGALTTLPALANIGATGGFMPHLASGGDWQTTFVLVNAGTTAAQASLTFFDDDGNPLALPLDTTSTPTIAAGAAVWIESAGQGDLLTGSAVLTTTGNVSGFVVFRYNQNGQEAVVPLETRKSASYLLAFDNTAGITTGVAINAVSTQAITVPVVIRDDTGASIGTGTIQLAANGHASFGLASQYPATLGIRGTIEFDAPTGAEIGVVGIRSPPALTFTTLPSLAK